MRQSIQGTFLQKRRYLDYHGKKFVDLSILIEANGETVGFLSAAQSLNSSKIVVSSRNNVRGSSIVII